MQFFRSIIIKIIIILRGSMHQPGSDAPGGYGELFLSSNGPADPFGRGLPVPV
jgi:hypothetical protein